MINPKRTLSLISGGLFNSESTWRAYLPDAENWQRTAVLLTLPLIFVAGIGAYVVGLLGTNDSVLGHFRPTLVTTLLNMLMAAIAAGVVAFIVSTLAGVFDGKNNFALGLAATSFAFIPGYLSQTVTWLPWIGWLVSLGLIIYGLVLLWRIIPIYLGVPNEKRKGHYVSSIICILLAMVVISMTVGRHLMPSFDSTQIGGVSIEPSGNRSVIGRAEMLAYAAEDTYDAPADGRISENQIEVYVDTLNKAREMQATTGFLSSEVIVVKSSGGNWAEHKWIRESLHQAYFRKTGDAAIEHNYRLYQKYETELATAISGN